MNIEKIKPEISPEMFPEFNRYQSNNYIILGIKSINYFNKTDSYSKASSEERQYDQRIRRDGN